MCVAPALVDLKSEIVSGLLLEGGRVVFPLPLLESLLVVRIPRDAKISLAERTTT